MGLGLEDAKKIKSGTALVITSFHNSPHMVGRGLKVGDIVYFDRIDTYNKVHASCSGFNGGIAFTMSRLDVRLVGWDDLNINKEVCDTVNKVDNVNHPKHYTSDECGIEAIELTSLLPNCIGNALKYVWRCGKKDEDIQELKKALWYVNYSIDNDLPSHIDDFSDTPNFEDLIKKVKSSWVGDKYVFIDAVYWGDQQLMKTALERMIGEVVG